MNQLCLDLQPTDPSYRLIYLTQGQVTLVDTEDYEWISQWKWRAKRNPRSGNFYAVRGVNNKRSGNITVWMASLILNTSTGTMPDHRNHDTLDNRRQNLRPATMEQNNQNRRIQKAKQVHFKGVVASQNKWRARIRANGKIFNLGTFPTPEDAHMAYVTAAQRLHGEFACFG